ncbi:condensation domain-containing protein [Streptomyces sp. NPDC001840]
MRTEATTGISRPLHPTLSLRLHGDLNLPALATAWRRVQTRHPVLLCGFDTEDHTWRLGEPAAPTSLTLLDAGPEPAVDSGPGSELGNYTAEAATVHLVEQCSDVPFDVEHGTLARLIVAPYHGTHLFALVVDHLVADFWSLDVLMRDLTTYYNSELGLLADPLPPVLLPFPEQVRRQNAYLESFEGQRTLHRLTENLKGIGPIPSTHMAGFTGATSARYDRTGLVRATLDLPLTKAVFATARKARTSPWSFTHAAVHAALYELSDQSAVGTTLMTANRESASVHQTVGFLASKVVVATGRPKSADATDFLKDFRRAEIRALDATQIPWPRSIAAMEPESFGHHSRSPYISFNPQNATMRRWIGNWRFTGCEAVPLDLSGSAPDAAIVISLTERHDGVSVAMYHRSDWYPAHAVEDFWATVDRRLRIWVAEAGFPAVS